MFKILNTLLVLFKKARLLKKLVPVLALASLLVLTACFKTNKTPAQVQSEQSTSSESSLGTANNEDVNSWLIPLISEYLIDNGPQCGDNTQTVTGNQTITTQADVNALATVNKIDGDLIIDPNAPNLDFSPLDLLTEITGDFELIGNTNQTTLVGFDCLITVADITIGTYDFNNDVPRGNPNLSSISGFSALKSIGGSLKIFYNDSLESISAFSALETVRFLSISHNASLMNLSAFSSLSSIGQDLEFKSNSVLVSIPDFPTLSSIARDIRINDNDALMSVPDFPVLSFVGLDFGIYSNFNLKSMSNFDTLTTVGGDFLLSNNWELITITGYNSLTTVGGYFRINSNFRLTGISGFNTLSTIGGSSDGGYFNIISNFDLESISGFSALTSVGTNNPIRHAGDFIINNRDLESIPDFNSLETVNGNFEIGGNNPITTIGGFSALKTIGGDFSIISNENLMSIPEFPSMSSINGDFTIGIADTINSIFTGNPKLVSISGFPILAFIGGDFSIGDNDVLTSISGFSTLNTVNGGVRIAFNTKLKDITDFPNLQTVGGGPNGGGFTIYYNGSLSNISAFSSLTTVGGNFALRNLALTSATSFSDLNSIDGIFNISNNNNSASISIPDFLVDLTGVSSIVVHYNGLTDLTTIKALSHRHAQVPDFYIGYNCLSTNKVPTKGILAGIDANNGTNVFDDFANPTTIGCPDPLPLQANSETHFDLDHNSFDEHEDWTLSGGGATNPGHSTSGGQSDSGHIYSGDTGNLTWYFKAPQQYYGDASDYSGGTLSFYLKSTDGSSPNNNGQNVRLQGIAPNGSEYNIYYDFPAPNTTPGTDWTYYEVPLSYPHWSNFTGTTMSQNIIDDTLGELIGVYIAGGYYDSGTEITRLDSVVLEKP